MPQAEDALNRPVQLVNTKNTASALPTLKGVTLTMTSPNVPSAQLVTNSPTESAPKPH
jgi:hypothetical protein